MQLSIWGVEHVKNILNLLLFWYHGILCIINCFMRRFTAPVAHFHASKVCIYVFFMSENQRLKFQIVAFSSSKCTYGLDFEDSGGFGLCLHITDVRDIIWKFVFKCDDVEFRKVQDGIIWGHINKKCPFFVQSALFNFRNSTSSHLRTNARIISLTSTTCKHIPKLPESPETSSVCAFWRAKCDYFRI